MFRYYGYRKSIFRRRSGRQRSGTLLCYISKEELFRPKKSVAVKLTQWLAGSEGCRGAAERCAPARHRSTRAQGRAVREETVEELRARLAEEHGRRYTARRRAPYVTAEPRPSKTRAPDD